MRNYDDTSDKQGRITIHDAKNSEADIDAVESGNEAIYENKASPRKVKENNVKSHGKTVTRTPYKNKEYLVVIGEEEAAANENDQNSDSGQNFEEKERLVGIPGPSSTASNVLQHTFLGFFTLLLACQEKL